MRKLCGQKEVDHPVLGRDCVAKMTTSHLDTTTPEDAFSDNACCGTGNVSASKEVQAFVLGGFPTTAVVSVSERNLEPFIGAGQGMKVLLSISHRLT